MSNRSPTRWPKLVGRFHLPSAVCPPSEISRKPRLRQARALGLDSGPLLRGTVEAHRVCNRLLEQMQRRSLFWWPGLLSPAVGVSRTNTRGACPCPSRSGRGQPGASGCNPSRRSRATLTQSENAIAEVGAVRNRAAWVHGIRGSQQPNGRRPVSLVTAARQMQDCAILPTHDGLTYEEASSMFASKATVL